MSAPLQPSTPTMPNGQYGPRSPATRAAMPSRGESSNALMGELRSNGSVSFNFLLFVGSAEGDFSHHHLEDMDLEQQQLLSPHHNPFYPLLHPYPIDLHSLFLDLLMLYNHNLTVVI